MKKLSYISLLVIILSVICVLVLERTGLISINESFAQNSGVVRDGEVTTASQGISTKMIAGSWQSGIGIKNLTASNNQITVEFFNATTGVKQPYVYSSVLSPQKGVELFLPNIPQLGPGSYTAKVTGKGAIGVSSTNTNYNTNLADSYNGMKSSNQFFVPGIYNNFNNWVSELFVQNADANPIRVSIEVSGTNLMTQAPVGPVTFGPLTIPGNATRSFDFSTNSPFNFDGVLGAYFLGSAKVTNAEGKTMAVVLYNTRVIGSSQVVLSYRGMTIAEDADIFLAAPVVYKNFSGWRSGINVQNVDVSDPVQARLTVRSQNGTFSATKTQVIQPRKSFEWYLPNVVFDNNIKLPDGFIGSAKVDIIDAGAGKVVGTVATTNYDRVKSLNTAPPGTGVALGYIMASRKSGKRTLSAPTVYKGFGTGTWNSSLVVSNVGTVAVSMSLQFASDTDSPAAYNKTISGFALGAGESKEFYLSNPAHLNGNTIPDGFKGSIFVNAAANSGLPKIAGIVQHANYGRGVATVYLTSGE